MKKIILSILIAIFGFSLTGCTNIDKDIATSYKPTFIYSEIVNNPTSLEDTVEAIYPSVVSIRSYINNRQYSSGSGILFSFDKDLNLSYILTCYHVIDKGVLLEAYIDGNTKPIEAKLVGGDKKNDVAVISIQGINYTYATLPKNNTLKLASQVIAIGNPLGTLPGSVSIGHVSYLNREVMSEDYTKMKLIQTDTAINSGNSGGGLFDSYGNLVGIVNAKFAKAGVEGLGFAIPIADAMNVVDDVFKTAKYDKNNNEWEKGYKLDSWELGFTVSDLISFPYTYLGISAISNNPNTSGYNQFTVGEQITNAYYKKDGKVIEIKISSSAEFYQSLYSLNLTLNDSFYVEVNRNNHPEVVEIKLIQFIPN